MSADEAMKLHQGHDIDILKQLVSTCVAQNNYYTSTPGSMYFMAKYDVMLDLSASISKLYQTHRGLQDPKSIMLRDDTYYKFFKWFKSISINPKYVYSDPFLIGSAWTPSRYNFSSIDMIITVKSERVMSLSDMIEPRDSLVKAICKSFIPIESILVDESTITLIMESPCKMCIHLAAYSSTPPFQYRLTWALNQYDEFLDSFSAISIFLHTWLDKVKKSCKTTGRLAIPSTLSINYLLIYFLQFYQLIPSLLHPENSDEEDLHRITPVSLQLLHLYNYFDTCRKDRIPNAGEIFTMLVYFYGYLVDLPYMNLDLITSKMAEKSDTSCEGLSIDDPEMNQDGNVPDAHRLQFLFRQAFHVIKNTDHNDSVYHRLMKLRYNENFNSVRDSIVLENPGQMSVIEDILEIVLDSDKDEDESNYKGATEVGHFVAKAFGTKELYQRKIPKNKSKVEQKPIQPCPSDFKPIRDLLDKPCLDGTKLPVPPGMKLVEKANNLFQITTLPNPNDLSELSVIFRPPQNVAKKLIPIVDDYLDDVVGYDQPVIESEAHDEPTYFDSVKSECFKEMEEQMKVLRLFKAASELPKQQTGRTGPKRTTKEVREACQNLNIGEGFTRFTELEENLKELENDWFEEV
ncbi:unnamed protein product [Caenorhabditis brenneri]